MGSTNTIFHIRNAMLKIMHEYAENLDSEVYNTEQRKSIKAEIKEIAEMVRDKDIYMKTLGELKPIATSNNGVDDKIQKRDSAIITLLSNCKIDISDISEINMKDIDFDDCKLTISKTENKHHKERTIYLNKACMKAINDYFEVRQRDNSKNNPYRPLFLDEHMLRIQTETVQDIVEKTEKNSEDNSLVMETRKKVIKLLHNERNKFVATQYSSVELQIIDQELRDVENLIMEKDRVLIKTRPTVLKNISRVRKERFKERFNMEK